MAKSSTSTGDDNPVPYVCLAVFEGTVSGDALIGDDILVNQGRRQGGGDRNIRRREWKQLRCCRDLPGWE